MGNGAVGSTLQNVLDLGLHEARVDRTYPGGTIGIISADLARYPQFEMSLVGVKYPYETKLDRRIGCDLVDNLNKIVRELSGEWLWILGDDHVFDRDILMRLLSRLYDDGRDMVAPLVMARKAPFPTVVGDLELASRQVNIVPIHECAGCQARMMVGSAGLLIRRKVLDTVGEPWFEAGALRRTGLGEDFHFCLKARDKGFQLYVDAGVLMGHITPAVIWPHAPGTDEAGIKIEFYGGYPIVVKQVVV